MHKFGGAALGDGDGVRRVGAILREHGGTAPVVVVSAHEGVTRMLDGVAHAAAQGVLDAAPVRLRHRSILRQLALPPELLDRLLAELATVLAQVRAEGRLDERRRDYVLSLGERMSARTVAAHLRGAGLPATPVDAFDLGLSCERRGAGRMPSDRSLDGVGAALRGIPGIPIVTGFLALDEEGHVATLGRNGSDLTAVWIGAAVGAAEVHLWKTVPAICSTDPKLVPEARTIGRLSYAAATELARQGAEVLHESAMEPARRAGLAVRVRSCAAPADPGTRIDAAAEPDPWILVPRLPRNGEAGPARLALVGGADAEGLAARLLEVARAEGLSLERRSESEACPLFELPARDLVRGLRVLHASLIVSESSA